MKESDKARRLADLARSIASNQRKLNEDLEEYKKVGQRISTRRQQIVRDMEEQESLREQHAVPGRAA